MSERSTVRIFISSPSDVRPERFKAEQIIARLDREFSYHFHVEAVLWEREPLVATHHFQDERNIPAPRAMDVVVVILWSRLGILLPEAFLGPLSRRPVTGTEWEFEDALASARERGVPELLLYRKLTPPTVELNDRKALEERLAQLDLVEDFIGRWFRAADGGQGFTAASHVFQTATEFEEKLYDHLHGLLDRRAGGRVDGVEIRWHEPPYRGLLSFDFEHAPVFFGRARARNELRELLAQREAAGCAFVMVLGASGCGKSSVVKAGLLPDLMLPGMIGTVGLTRWSTMRPSDGRGDLHGALAAAILSATALPELTALQYTPEALAALLRAAPRQAALPIRQGLAAAGTAAGLTETGEARLALVIDQLEEMFTIDGIGQVEREAFVAALEVLARSGLVWVLTTMRSDFFDRLETLPALVVLSNRARFLLLPPDPAEIGQIIRQPALEAGLRFETDPNRVGLDEVIRQATAEAKGALPLLSFVLDQLWRRRSDAGLLTFAAYRELGELEGAIGRSAEEVFLAQPAEVQKAFAPVLRALVTVEGGTATSRTAPLSLFPPRTPQRALVDALLDPHARLLVADTDADAAHETQLRLAHEALLTHWPRAREQVAADARDLELRGRLEQEAERWRAAPRRDKPRRVASGLMLAEARALAARWGADLPDTVRAFVTASWAADRRRRRRLAATVVGAVLSLPVLVGLVWVAMVWSGVRAVEAEMAFVTIPAGCFDMGSPDGEAGRFPNEGPVHRVCPRAFELGKFEVTQGQWHRVMIYPNTPDPSRYKGDNLPVESISWSEAGSFVFLMSFFGHGHYRLPSEAEWEYAARAGTETARYWGDDFKDACTYENLADRSLEKYSPGIVPAFAACDDGHAATAPVGSYRPNSWGLHDMLGNVSEWVEDCHADSYREAPADGAPNLIGNCTYRVVRGGSWFDGPRGARAAYRLNFGAPDYRRPTIGLRLARTPSR